MQLQHTKFSIVARLRNLDLLQMAISLKKIELITLPEEHFWNLNMEKALVFKTPGNLIGENMNYDRSALSGYKAEGQIKRLLSQNNDKVTDYLSEVHKIPDTIKVKKDETDSERMKRLKYELPEPYEHFTSIELLKDNVVSLNSRACIKAVRIYEKEGLMTMVDYLIKAAPIQIL